MTDAFRALIERAAQTLGSQAALAAALGIDPARISRLKCGAGVSRRLNVENCLRLAAILAIRPPEVLRAAGHTDLASLLDTHWAAPADGDAGGAGEQRLLRLWRDLSPARQSALLNLLGTEGGPAVAIRRRPRFRVASRIGRAGR